jgi:hypothetical protein
MICMVLLASLTRTVDGPAEAGHYVRLALRTTIIERHAHRPANSLSFTQYPRMDPHRKVPIIAESPTIAEV